MSTKKEQKVQYVMVKNQKHGGAAILSFLFPGLGQLVQGRVGRGLLFMIFTLVTLPTIIIPLVLWIWSVVDAYN